MRGKQPEHSPLSSNASAQNPAKPGARGTTALDLLIVSANKDTRAALHTAAVNTGLFRSVQVMADARFALERLADGGDPTGGRLPDILVADREMAGLRVTQLLRQIRQAGPMGRMFVAVFAPKASPSDLDAIESAGSDFIIRGVQPLAKPTQLFRTLVYRHAAKSDPVALVALNVACGTLGGCGLDVPAIA